MAKGEILNPRKTVAFKKVTHKTLGEAVVGRESFIGPSSRGGSIAEVGEETGMLPSHLRDAMQSHKPSYVVKSYNTPVAWYGEKGWVVPDVKYSRTTSRLQGGIRRSINAHFADAHNSARS